MPHFKASTHSAIGDIAAILFGYRDLQTAAKRSLAPVRVGSFECASRVAPMAQLLYMAIYNIIRMDV